MNSIKFKQKITISTPIYIIQKGIPYFYQIKYFFNTAVFCIFEAKSSPENKKS